MPIEQAWDLCTRGENAQMRRLVERREGQNKSASKFAREERMLRRGDFVARREGQNKCCEKRRPKQISLQEISPPQEISPRKIVGR